LAGNPRPAVRVWTSGQQKTQTPRLALSFDPFVRKSELPQKYNFQNFYQVPVSTVPDLKKIIFVLVFNICFNVHQKEVLF